ncbi:MAG: TolC family protein [Myxococcales bacterium]|nr:MAG: TolC family protein [Myxococcales bacterium]
MKGIILFIKLLCWIVAALFINFAMPIESFAEQADKRRKEQVLHPEDVVRSVQKHHPHIRIALEQLKQAEGKLTEADGGFDPRLEASGKSRSGGYYELRSLDVGLKQATGLWGAELFAGYRLGLGLEDERYPSYYSDETLGGGEVRGGVQVPLWRGGPIDERRAKIRSQEKLLHASEQVVRATSLSLELQAIKHYWQWVAAGLAREVALELLELAEERDRQLSQRLSAGAVTEFDLWDNQRMVLERKEGLIKATRHFEQSTIALSMFLRDSQGRPLLAQPTELPHDILVLEAPTLDTQAALRQVSQCHPLLRSELAKVEAYGVTLDLAKNQFAPQVDLKAQLSRDLGDASRNTTLPGTVFEGGVTFSMPLLLRPERGRLTQRKAEIMEAKEKLRYVRDNLVTSVHDAASALKAAHRQAQIVNKLVQTAEKLAEGERTRFDSGMGNLMFVNLREQSSASARLDLIEALVKSHVAKARWSNLTAVGCH